MIARLFNRARRALRKLGADAVRGAPVYVGDDTLLLRTLHGFYLYVDGRDVSLTPCLVDLRTWEPHIVHFLERLLREGDMFVDVGANIGFFSLLAARRVRASGKVIACEPQERLCRLMRRSLAANRLEEVVSVLRLGCGAAPGAARLGLFEMHAGSASFTPNHLIVDHEEVEIAPLDAILADHAGAIEGPARTVIKIDVEGFEHEVWRGMRESVARARALTIVMEFSPLSYRNLGVDPLGFLAEMEAAGLTLCVLQARGGAVPLDAPLRAEIAAASRYYDLVARKE